MDPLSDILCLLKPQSYVSGAFEMPDGFAIQFPAHQGIKFYAMVAGQCWIRVGKTEPVLLTAGDCFLLPHGLPFRLASDLSLPAVDAAVFRAARRLSGADTDDDQPRQRHILAAAFELAGPFADILLKLLPPIVHIRTESGRAAMHWSLQRLRQELRTPQPGGALIAQQLAYVMLVQALRLHLADAPEDSIGWLFALADERMNLAITCMHAEPAHRWCLQELAQRVGMSRSVFALRFKEKVGMTPMAYLTRWRMLLAGDRLKSTDDAISSIAFSLGYESESAFRKAFRMVMGSSPREYGRAVNHDALRKQAGQDD